MGSLRTFHTLVHPRTIFVSRVIQFVGHVSASYNFGKVRLHSMSQCDCDDVQHPNDWFSKAFLAIQSDGNVITWGGEGLCRGTWAGNEDGFLESSDESLDEDWIGFDVLLADPFGLMSNFAWKIKKYMILLAGIAEHREDPSTVSEGSYLAPAQC